MSETDPTTDVSENQSTDIPEEGAASPEPVAPKSTRRKKGSGPSHAKKGGANKLQKSTRTRRILIIVVILLIVLAAALVASAYALLATSQDAAIQQTNNSKADDLDADESSSPGKDGSKTTSVPDLVALIGLDQAQAVEKLGHGAQATGSNPSADAATGMESEVKVALTEEPSDSKSGTPTVYLGLDAEGRIVRVGYTVAISSLGYGKLSFADAVQNEHIVEETLGDAGLDVETDTVKLPEDKSKYSTYDSDGTTLVKEYCKFDGKGTAGGAQYSWQASLSYDYTMANASDNLNDSIRTISIYITKAS